MALQPAEVRTLADRLAEAEQSRRPINPLTAQYPSLSEQDAYQIQLDLVERRTARGARVVGRKIGLTSRAMQELLGVFEPDYGHLVDQMLLPSGAVVELAQLIQPKVEGELAFILGEELRGPGVTPGDVLAATRLVVPAIEIVDSRIRDWQIRLADTIADNASSALFLLGDNGLPPERFDLRLVGMLLHKNESLCSTGTGAAVLGHPALAVAWLANKLSQFGLHMQAGEVILSGAITAAVPVQPGDRVSAHFDHLGEVSVQFQ